MVDKDGELEEEETVKVGDREIPLSEVTDEDRQQMNSEEYKVSLHIQYPPLLFNILQFFLYHQFIWF